VFYKIGNDVFIQCTIETRSLEFIKIKCGLCVKVDHLFMAHIKKLYLWPLVKWINIAENRISRTLLTKILLNNIKK
jgi:hypothetical protein